MYAIPPSVAGSSIGRHFACGEENLIDIFLVFAKVAGGREKSGQNLFSGYFSGIHGKIRKTYFSGNCGVFPIFPGFWGL